MSAATEMENDMPWMPMPDPYTNFKDDGERRLALEHRERWMTLRAIGVALASLPALTLSALMLPAAAAIGTDGAPPPRPGRRPARRQRARQGSR